MPKRRGCSRKGNSSSIKSNEDLLGTSGGGGGNPKNKGRGGTPYMMGKKLSKDSPFRTRLRYKEGSNIENLGLFSPKCKGRRYV